MRATTEHEHERVKLNLAKRARPDVRCRWTSERENGGGERRGRCQPSRCGAGGADRRTRRTRGSRSKETGAEDGAERRVERESVGSSAPVNGRV